MGWHQPPACPASLMMSSGSPAAAGGWRTPHGAARRCPGWVNAMLRFPWSAGSSCLRFCQHAILLLLPPGCTCCEVRIRTLVRGLAAAGGCGWLAARSGASPPSAGAPPIPPPPPGAPWDLVQSYFVTRGVVQRLVPTASGGAAQSAGEARRCCMLVHAQGGGVGQQYWMQ